MSNVNNNKFEKEYLNAFPKDIENAEKLKKFAEERKLKTKDFSNILFEKYSSLYAPEEISDLIKESEGMKKCKWCGEWFKDTDDFCSVDCLEKYALEQLKK